MGSEEENLAGGDSFKKSDEKWKKTGSNVEKAF